MPLIRLASNVFEFAFRSTCIERDSNYVLSIWFSEFSTEIPAIPFTAARSDNGAFSRMKNDRIVENRFQCPRLTAVNISHSIQSLSRSHQLWPCYLPEIAIVIIGKISPFCNPHFALTAVGSRTSVRFNSCGSRKILLAVSISSSVDIYIRPSSSRAIQRIPASAC